MRNPFDQFGKSLAGRFMEQFGQVALRLLGRDAILSQALQEAARLERGSPLQRLLGPLVVAFRSHILQALDLTQEPHMHVFEQWQAIYNEWERETTDRGRREGVKEGVKKGEARGLLRLLARRFGPLPETVTARVARASIEDIERWFDRAVDAATMDDVFAR